MRKVLSHIGVPGYLSKKNIITTLLAVTLCFTCTIAMQAQDVETKKDQVRQLEEEIALLDKQIRSATQQQKSTLSGLMLIKRKVAQRQKLLNELDKRLKNQNADLDKKTAHLLKLESNLNSLQKSYKHLVISAYKNRDMRKWFMFILASDNIEQGYRRWIYLKDYAKAINDQGKKIKGIKREVSRQRESLVIIRDKTAETQKVRESEYNKFKSEEKETQAVANVLAKQQKNLRVQLDKKKREAANLNREIERMLAKAIRQSKTKNTRSSESNEADIKLSGEFGSNKGKLPWPVSNGVVAEQFGEHDHPVLKNVKLPFNNGINISAPRNSNVKSVFDGTIKQIIIIPGYSHCILVQHGSYFTFYCKLGSVAVSVGEKVSTGTVLGRIDEDILHFELWNGSAKQNPESWLR
jgi:murein hydrolase activator